MSICITDNIIHTTFCFKYTRNLFIWSSATIYTEKHGIHKDKSLPHLSCTMTLPVQCYSTAK